ncbi:betaine--homocysteine S-methyltransferase 1-like isoform X2 [Ornithodoros turicata]|uniref:betaine--homocysteine S-methyltransferase 1-like isoform X2 n=1 Tax=Ornithodoros turicata TaxID=34597 RepID=UPI003139C4FC
MSSQTSLTSDRKPSEAPSEGKASRNLLARLGSGGVVIGDGGFVFSLEKRGYVKAGPWTPEAVIEHPEAVRQLHREFLRAGSDVMQAFTFYASDDKLINRGNEAGRKFTGEDINVAACKIAKEVASEGTALVAGGVSQTPAFLSGRSKAQVQEEFRKQVRVFIENQLDFLVCEYFEHVEEIEIAIKVCKETPLPIVATMCIGPEGDLHGVSAGECAVRMVKAGAHVVGVNCHFDPFVVLETVKLMIDAVNASGLKAHFITQPLAYHTPDAGKQGFIDLPEFPFALEPRVCTRWDMQRYAREAYEMGVRYIGGCCGFEPYHIRALAEELAEDRHSALPEASEKHDPWGAGLKMHTKPWVRARAFREYWETLKPATGRPFSSAYSQPDNWGVTAGAEELKQKAEDTTKEELEKLHQFKK